MNKIYLLGISSALMMLLTGCATMFSGTHQDVKFNTNHYEVGAKLNSKTTLEVISDKNRVRNEIKGGDIVSVHRTSKPIIVKVKESECILPSEESFDSGTNSLVILDVLMTSLLSTSIDSSTGALWEYDDSYTVTPKVKNTPECQEWLKKIKNDQL